MDTELKKWAYAIAERITDEWNGKKYFPEDAIILRSLLYDFFVNSWHACEKIIGTGIIEEDYFEPLS